MAHYRNAQGEEAGPITHTDFLHAAGTCCRFTLDLACPHCGWVGKVTWEENDPAHRQAGPQRHLVDVSPGFHLESGRTRSNDLMIICNECDSILPN